MSRLCIVPCGAKKIWDLRPDAGPTEAQHAYVGAFTKKCISYAYFLFFSRWLILSAKYGFLAPSDIIPEAFNVSFNSRNSSCVGVETLRSQAARRGLLTIDEIVILGGRNYSAVLRRVIEKGPVLKFPLEGLTGIRYMLQKLDRAIKYGNEIWSE